jgi:putative ABC transport system permease protein
MFRFALYNLLSRKARSALALLGLTVAIVGMVGLFSVIEGLKRISKESFDRIPGIIVLQTGAPVPLFSRLPAEWEKDLKQVEKVKIVSPEIWFRVNVIEGQMTISPPRFLFGVDIPTWNALESALYRDDIVEGRFLTEQDRGTDNAVVSRSIQEEFGLKLGDRFTVNGDEATLIGVYDSGSLLIDITIAMDRGIVQKRTRFDTNSVSAYYLETTDGDNKAAIERIKDAFRGRLGEPWKPSMLSMPADENPFQSMLNGLDRMLKSHSKAESISPEPKQNEPPAKSKPSPSQVPRKKGRDGRLQVDESLPIDVQSAEQWSERFNQFTENLDYIMFILASIGVTIAVLGIANTMLMSVSERIIEIGILKANGWSKKHVLSLIAYESAILGFLGGCLGSLIGWVGTLIVNAKFADHVSLYAGPGLILFSILFATVLGLLAGLYPAVWAMRLMPMDAIRRG